MTDSVDIKKAAELLGKTERQIRFMCINGTLSGAVKNGNRWKIPMTAHPKLNIAKDSQELLNSAELRNVPANKRQEALQRLGILQNFKKFAAEFVRNGGLQSDAFEVYASQHNTSKRSLERWNARYREQGLIGLVDMRGGGKFISQMLSPEAFEVFKSMYLTQQQLSIKTCWQNILFINRSEEKDWQVPELHFMYRYVKNYIPLPVQILHREGLAAYEAKCAPYIQTDPDSVAPGQIWVGDHSQLNCWIRHRGKWIRPWVTAWLDMRSRCIVGFHLSASPNQTTILLAMKRAIEKYGPPDSVKIDNGKDYDSECWTGTTKARRRALKAGYIDKKMVAGIYAMMGVGISFSIKYHPQSKRIERWFDTIDCQFTKTLPTYCGKDTERKPDYLNDLLKSEKQIHQAHSLESFTVLVGKYIEVYNNSAHTGSGMEGKSPAQVLAGRSSRRVMAEGVSDLLLRVRSGELTVSKNGVRFHGIWYGQFNTDLLMLQGKKVRLSYDPDDLRTVYVYDATTLKLLTIAEQNQLIRYGSPVSEESFREAARQKSRATKIVRQFCDSQLTANTDLPSLTIKAMQEGAREAAQPPAAAIKTLRPVKTPFDGQVAEHGRREVLKAVKKAAGAESIEKVLDFDFSLLKPEHEIIDLELFNE